MRLKALHVIAAAIKLLKSAELLSVLPSLVLAITPSLSSALVDIRKVRHPLHPIIIHLINIHPISFPWHTFHHLPSRPHTKPSSPSFLNPPPSQAVIFVLVESYMVIGDALYPFVSALPLPQKKLLTIYISKQSSPATGTPGNNHHNNNNTSGGATTNYAKSPSLKFGVQ